MKEKLQELRTQFFNSALSVSPEELLSILPSPSFSNFLVIMRGIIEALNKEIDYFTKLINDSTDKEEKEMYIDEIKTLQAKCRICEKVLSDSYSITIEEEVDESKKINIIFGVTPGGSIAFLNDLKRNVDEHYYSEILELLEQLELGEFVSNQEKVRKFNSNNSKLAGLMELKGFQIRLFFRQLPNNILYVDMIRIKKDDNVTKDLQEPIKRLALLAQDFECIKRRIKNGDRVDELILEGEEMLAEVKSFLTENLNKGRGKNGE